VPGSSDYLSDVMQVGKDGKSVVDKRMNERRWDRAQKERKD